MVYWLCVHGWVWFIACGFGLCLGGCGVVVVLVGWFRWVWWVLRAFVMLVYYDCFSFGWIVCYCWLVVWVLFGVGLLVIGFVFDLVALVVAAWVCYVGLLYCWLW